MTGSGRYLALMFAAGLSAMWHDPLWSFLYAMGLAIGVTLWTSGEELDRARSRR